MKLKPALQFSEGRSKPWSGSKLVNCFAEKADGDQRDDFAVMATPGLVQFASLGASAIRGTHTMGTVLYAVMGAELYSVTSGGVGTLIGGVPGSDLCRMADNGAELAIASGGVGYVLSSGVIYTPLLFSASDVIYVDGYFLWTVADSDQFTISSLNDGLTYDALDVATVEGAPDNVVGVVNDHRDVEFYGGATVEIWYNTGNADFPFERQGNAFIERGCFDRDSIAKIDNSTHFMGEDRIIYRLNGYTPTRISTHAIEYQLRNTTYCRGFAYAQEGHTFYCITTSNGTFCYDMSTSAWHQRKSDGVDYWRVGGAIVAYGGPILSDATTGKLYTPSLDVFDENGATISSVIELPTIEGDNRQLVSMYLFEVLCETGVGLNSGQGSDPMMMLQYSDDGGRNWSNELWRTVGAIGRYTTRCIWRKLGKFRQRQIRLTITDPVRRLMISYFADIR